MNTGKAKGTVFHGRVAPKVHQFKYKMHWHLIDLHAVTDWSDLSVKHQYNQWSVYAIHDKDYIDKSSISIKDKIHSYLTSKNIEDCDHIILMTHPRYFGFSFNSVSFYFCYRESELVAIVSEINNTPWGEKQLYCHDAQDLCGEKQMVFRFKKQFHISPFVPMDIDYNWTFDVTDEAIKVEMKLLREEKLMMQVRLNTQVETSISPSWFDFGMGQALKMWSAIYWQSVKLWFKKMPFYDHPKIVKYSETKHSRK